MLKVQKIFEQAALPLADAGEPERRIQIPGYQPFKSDFLLRPLSGKLGEKLTVTPRNTFDRIDAWDLVIDGNYPIKKGYSGSPVIDLQSGKVVGVASHRLDSGEKGVAVSIGALPGLWPDMPDALRRAFEPTQGSESSRTSENAHTKQKKSPICEIVREAGDFQVRTTDEAQGGQSQPNFSRLPAKLCDRDPHEGTFWDFFCKHEDDAACRGRPKFFFIHGNAGECHMNLIERLRQTKIKYYVENRYQDESALPYLIKAPVSVEKDLSVHQTRIYQNTGPTRSVVLIDEIDKAPRDLPNDVLNEIEDMRFRVRETDWPPFEADPKYRPILILTSNSEKNLPDAFVRRCVFYHIPFPDKTALKNIIVRRFSDVPEFDPVMSDGFIDSALDHFDQIRSLNLKKPRPLLNV